MATLLSACFGNDEPEFVFPTASATEATERTLADYEVGSEIELASRDDVTLTVNGIEWRDRLRRLDTGTAEYIDSTLGHFLVVTFEIRNGGSDELDPGDAFNPFLEDETGKRYRPDALLGMLDGAEPGAVLHVDPIRPRGSATGMRFFDVPSGFPGGYLQSDQDLYRIPVGTPQ